MSRRKRLKESVRVFHKSDRRYLGTVSKLHRVGYNVVNVKDRMLGYAENNIK